MAEFMTQKFINAKQNDQIAIMKAIDYAIIERYGITGHPGGKELAMEIINTKYGVSNAMDEIAEMPVRPDVAQILSKDSIVYKDGIPYKKTGSIIQPFQETNAVSALDYFALSQYAYELKSKKNLFLSLGGATQSKTASEVVNFWSLFTLFPRLGIRSAIDEAMSGSLRSWLTYIALREKNGTQKEHIIIAKECKKIFCDQFPIISEALGGFDKNWCI